MKIKGGLKYGLQNSDSQVNGKVNNLEKEIGKIIHWSLKRGDFREFKQGGLHEKHAVATWHLGPISAFI
jgi:hypothetical protein